MMCLYAVVDIQAAAAGNNGRVVEAVLAALSLNHKHFGGRLPNLLLIHAVRTMTASRADVRSEAMETAAGCTNASTKVSTVGVLFSHLARVP